MAIVDLSRREREIIAHLKREGRSWLDLRQDGEWLGKISDSPKDLVHRMRGKGLLHTVQRGRYVLNLDESSTRSPRLRALEPLVETVLERLGTPNYLSWHSGLWHHGLIDQQSRRLYVAITGRKRDAHFPPWEIRFVSVAKRKFFGGEETTIAGTSVRIASVEKSIIDSFDQPHLAAHPGVVAHSLARAWRTYKLDPEKLVAAAIRFNSPTLVRRLGFFMEQFEIPGAEKLRPYIGKRYAVPLAPGWEEHSTESHVDTGWGVIVDDELLYAATTPK